MAIHSPFPQAAQPAQPISSSVEAWTASTLQNLTISSAARGTGTSLVIPLDEVIEEQRAKRVVTNKPRKDLLRRDSLKSREALLKGKDGSRRRQRWENDRLLHVPNIQPPLPSDWAVCPTHPVIHVPYYLAPLWDAGVRRCAEESAAAKQEVINQRNGKDINSKPHIAGQLRKRVKKSKGAKSLLVELEEEIRAFVVGWDRELKIARGMGKDEQGVVDSEDEEIVFVGRDGRMSDEVRGCLNEELEKEKLVWESAEGERGGTFGYADTTPVFPQIRRCFWDCLLIRSADAGWCIL